jgi:putative flippase GtrA
MIGVICTAINYLLFYGLFSFNTPYLLASGLGFITGVFVGYPLNRRWTYRVDEQSSRQFLRYCSVYVASLMLSLVCLKLLVEFFTFDPRIANVLVIGVSTCTNYLGVKLLVFRSVAKNSAASFFIR